MHAWQLMGLGPQATIRVHARWSVRPEGQRETTTIHARQSVGPEGPQEDGRVHAWQLMGPEGPQRPSRSMHGGLQDQRGHGHWQGPCMAVNRTGGTTGDHQDPRVVVCRTRGTMRRRQGPCTVVSMAGVGKPLRAGDAHGYVGPQCSRLPREGSRVGTTVPSQRNTHVVGTRRGPDPLRCPYGSTAPLVRANREQEPPQPWHACSPCRGCGCVGPSWTRDTSPSMGEWVQGSPEGGF